MAIRGEDITIDMTSRDNLMSHYQSNLRPGEEPGPITIPTEIAGITPGMEANINTAIDNYNSRVNGILDGILNVASSSAFEGQQIKRAIANFIDTVKTVAHDYSNTLKNVEKDIVSAVHRAYERKDTNESSEVDIDANIVNDTAPTQPSEEEN